MKRKYQRILKKTAAFVLILALAISLFPAAMAAGSNRSDLKFTVSWTDSNGNIQTADAVYITDSETGEGCFWVMLPPDAPLDSLTFSAVDPSQGLDFSAEEKPVTDPRMARNWPGSLWRVRLQGKPAKDFSAEFAFAAKDQEA